LLSRANPKITYSAFGWRVLSTGEETYSIAMLLREFMDETRQELKIQIYQH